MIRNKEAVLNHYVKCMLWAEQNEISGNTFEYDNYDIEDIHPPDLKTIKEDIKNFLINSHDLLTEEWTDEQIGHDFYLTRNGHGAGFWDRGLPNGDELSDKARSFGASNCFAIKMIGIS